MVIERTLSILKPDSVKKNLIGAINSIFEKNGLKIVAQRMIWITDHHARLFYMEHEEKPFFEGLVKYMTSGPVVVQVLEGENAIRKNRQLMGKTNPAEADEGTIRRMYGESIEVNSVHGSDSVISVEREIRFFFSMTEVY
ncbi:MAG: nucleoside-diphosphate kinase [Rickettsiales bacterium]|jgi:nucleoside-diphosphate kinase|nr:nucleoside-diphosphate kinase [Rickettsiales bacterium]